MDKKTENLFYDLLGLQLSGRIKPEEATVFNKLREQNPDLDQLFQEIVHLPAKPDYDADTLRQAYAAHYVKKKLLPEFQIDKTQAKKRFRRRVIWLGGVGLALAACLLGVLIFRTYFGQFEKPEQVIAETATYVTLKGSKKTFRLPDGTAVVLNADSRLDYDPEFTGRLREVKLTGEAFFDVVHNKKRPFVIHAGKANIRVLGTVLNVRNYPGDKFMETSLIKGKVEVTFRDQPGKKIIMKPSQKLVIPTADLQTVSNRKLANASDEKPVLTNVTMEQDSSVAETSWTTNKLVFINRPLSEITAELERQFNVQFRFKRPATRKFRYTIHVEDYELTELLQILKLSGKINYSIQNNEVIIE